MSASKGNRDQFEMQGEGAPRDPGLAGFVGKRRAVYGAIPDPEGNRQARRAYARAQRQQARRKR